MLCVIYFGFTIVKQSLPHLRVRKENCFKEKHKQTALKYTVDTETYCKCGRRKFYLGGNIFVNSEVCIPTSLKAYALGSLLAQELAKTFLNFTGKGRGWCEPLVPGNMWHSRSLN